MRVVLGAGLSAFGAWLVVGSYLSWVAWEASSCGSNPGPGPHHPCPIMLPPFLSPVFWLGVVSLSVGIWFLGLALYLWSRGPRMSRVGTASETRPRELRE
jgi:hypothetical protein